jgi:hypothetical protein
MNHVELSFDSILVFTFMHLGRSASVAYDAKPLQSSTNGTLKTLTFFVPSSAENEMNEGFELN